MENNFSAPAFAWILVTVICLGLILMGLKAGLKRTGWTPQSQAKIFLTTAFFISGWTALLLILAGSGMFVSPGGLPPRPAIAALIPLPFIIAFAFSRKGTELLRSVPPHWIIFLQSFRIAVELLLLIAFVNNKLPVQMTFEGRNFDIVSGILALPVGYVLASGKSWSRNVAILYNVIGLLLLLNIVVIAVLSMPSPIRYFMNEPANTLVAETPYILLPGVLVPLAYGLHILSLRQLVAKKQMVPAALR
jgi:hypothetical protein